jgi:hypothetical protein
MEIVKQAQPTTNNQVKAIERRRGLLRTSASMRT